MAERIPRVPVREQDPKVRAHNFEEVCFGYDLQEAMLEASRCLHCKNPRCVTACPVSIKIPEFIAKVKEGDIQGAAAVIGEDSSLPAVCGRVCPQETQCEGSCILGIKGESVAIGKLERFVADHSAESDEMARPAATVTPGAKKVAVIGSGPAGLACASDLAKWGYDVTIFEALHRPGGVLEYGIPEFRLPKDAVLKREINEVKALGVKIETDVIIGRTVTIDSLMDNEGFEAVFVGTGHNGTVTRSQLILLKISRDAVGDNRPHRVDDIFAGQVVGLGDFGLTSRFLVTLLEHQLVTFLAQLHARCGMDGTVDALVQRMETA